MRHNQGGAAERPIGLRMSHCWPWLAVVAVTLVSCTQVHIRPGVTTVDGAVLQNVPDSPEQVAAAADAVFRSMGYLVVADERLGAGGRRITAQNAQGTEFSVVAEPIAPSATRYSVSSATSGSIVVAGNAVATVTAFPANTAPAMVASRSAFQTAFAMAYSSNSCCERSSPGLGSTSLSSTNI